MCGSGRMAKFWVSLVLKDYNTVFEFIFLEEEIYLNQDNYYEAISKCHNKGNANKLIYFILKTILDCIRKPI